MIQLTPADYKINQTGVMTDAQKTLLRRYRLGWMVSTAVFILTLFATITTIWIIVSGTLSNTSPLWLLLIVMLFWCILLSRAPLQWQKASRDLQNGRISSLESSVQYDITSRPGLISLMAYKLRAGDMTFQLSKENLFFFKNQERYQLFYAPHSYALLGAILASDVLGETAVKSPMPSKNEHRPFPDPLTPRELELLQLMAEGLSNQEIADRLFLSVNTVKAYASQLYSKLNVSRRTEAVARAREQHLLE